MRRGRLNLRDSRTLEQMQESAQGNLQAGGGAARGGADRTLEHMQPARLLLVSGARSQG